MTRHNTARSLHGSQAGRIGIHLVHSRAWKDSSPRGEVAKERKAVRRIRPQRRVSPFTLALAAVSGPLVWVGHALLKSIHLR